MPPSPRHRRSAAPVLPVRDLNEAVVCYRRLGFAVDTAPAYAVASWGEAPVLLLATPGLDRDANTAGALLTSADAAAVRRSWVESGAGGAVSALRTTDIGTVEFFFRDRDGNVLRVVSAAPVAQPGP